MKPYNYLIVGAGLYGAMFAFKATREGKRCLVIDRRPHPGGNLYNENIGGINVHTYGPHIFHTSNPKVWHFVNSLVEFNRFTYSPTAHYKGKLYNLPFNMNTFYALWGVKTPEEARCRIAAQRKAAGIIHPANLEEQALSMVGKDIYEILIRGYSEKQWGRSCRELPAFLIKRIPLRFTFDNNYFDDTFQGIPVGGYNRLINGLLAGIETRCNTDFFTDRDYFGRLADTPVFTGRIDEYYQYCWGKLAYRSVRFETETPDCENYQGNAVVNYTERDVPYTRIIEHKHFEYGKQSKTVISKEYPSETSEANEPFYPINDERNNAVYQRYKAFSEKENRVIFGGRLAEYTYYDMDDIIEQFI